MNLMNINPGNRRPATAAPVTFVISPARRLVMFICLALLGWLISGFINELLIGAFGLTTRVMRIAAVVQGLFQMVLPAIALAVVITRNPAGFLAIDRKFHPRTVIFAILAMVLSIPAMNLLIKLNADITFPEALESLERSLRSMEQSAAGNVELLQGGATVGDLIMSILIVGIFAGFGEELLFRGAFLRTLLSMKINRHLAVWIVAFVFSALHFQFFGFFPRLLLGAFFGYAFIWSGSLWLPIVLHALNNILYVVSRWLSLRGVASAENIDSIGAGGDMWLPALVSVLMTVLFLSLLYKSCKKKAVSAGEETPGQDCQ